METQLQLEPAGGDERVQSVSALTALIKRLLEETLPSVWVRGELSNVRAQSSGHVYFTLKDEGASLSCAIFRNDLRRLTVQLRDGMQVVVEGKISVYPPQGKYQLIARSIVEDGVGRLQQEFERLKARLDAEGLFDAEKKREIPAMPETIGFITSPTGAAVQDFVRILKRREWRGRVVVLPVKVQGEGAAAEMVEMLRFGQDAQACGINFDLFVIGRGGGSLEDLWAFNEEPLVRAVAGCAIPIISAVGHEIDFTLCDFAADRRAETPSGAAELISSGFIDCLERVSGAVDAIDRSAESTLERCGSRLDAARDQLRILSPESAVEQAWQRIDELAIRLGSAMRAGVNERTAKLAEVRALLGRRSPEFRVRLESQKLLGLWKRLESVSPPSVLNRGFVIMRDEHGAPVARSVAVSAGQQLEAEWADGRRRVKAEG
ncbi:MAG TPA: exodeoxyribonuclease VII large subunit [Opitutaceae bacterium]|nr:exodeoxyribonuclease VII large subunit [Opitutaceae bacterium]